MKKIFSFLMILILAFEILSQPQNTNKEPQKQDNEQQNQQKINTKQNPQQNDEQKQEQQNTNIQEHQQQNNTQQNQNQNHKNMQQNNNNTQESQQQNNAKKQEQQNNSTHQKHQQQNNNAQQKQQQQNNNIQKQQQQNNNDQQKQQQQNNNAQQKQQQNNNAQQNKNANTNIKPNKTQGQKAPKNQTQNKYNTLNNTNINNTIPVKNKTEETKEKIFNLTESLIKFFKDTFGSKNDTDKNKTVNETGKKKEEIESEVRRRQEQIELQRIMQEKERIRREEIEMNRKAELVRIENKRKEERRKREQEERAKFEALLTNTTFEETIQISLEKGESETLYLDLQSFVKLKMAVLCTDNEDKITFFFSGPDSRGRTSVLYKVYEKNYLFHEYETMRKGEYMVEITNRGKKQSELFFFVKEHNEIKKDNIDTQKIDKISMFLNEIDSNVNALRNKKKMEIRQINSHNEKVDNNNRSIVIYSIVEIVTMFIIFIAQSYYISSIVEKL